MIFLLLFAGLLAGLVDSISGGGGLISLPTLALYLGQGPLTVGTNKIPGFIAATAAFLVFLKKGHFKFSQGFLFAASTGIGSFFGTLAGPRVPIEAFRWFLIVTGPLVLFLVFKKDFWIQRAPSPNRKTGVALVVFSGLMCGLYDGVWGPGAGIFMALSLIFIARIPILNAMASAKLANALSAGIALTSYQAQGLVSWKEGFFVAAGILVGALVGSNLAIKGAEKVVRPVLVVAVLLLMSRLFF
jgi:uncharacterized protein